MLYRPHKDNVFLIPEKRDRKTSAGLFIPDTADGQLGAGYLICTVYAAGPGGKGDDGRWWPVDVVEGERCVIKKHAGEIVVIGDDIDPASAPDLEAGTEVRVVRNEEILCVLPPLAETA